MEYNGDHAALSALVLSNFWPLGVFCLSIICNLNNWQYSCSLLTAAQAVKSNLTKVANAVATTFGQHIFRLTPDLPRCDVQMEIHGTIHTIQRSSSIRIIMNSCELTPPVDGNCSGCPRMELANGTGIQSNKWKVMGTFDIKFLKSMVAPK